MRLKHECVPTLFVKSEKRLIFALFIQMNLLTDEKHIHHLSLIIT